MGTEQLTFTEAELLATHDVTEPLIAGGILCHGGFDADGHYVSPRTKHRAPAIAAWQDAHRERFGTELLDVALETWPEHYPNVAQARYLLSEGIGDLLALTLTRIGTVEGFGAMVRHLPVPDFRTTLRRRRRWHRARPPRPRPVRSARSRRSRLRRARAGTARCGARPATLPLNIPSCPTQTDVMRRRMAMSQQNSYERVLPDDVAIDMELLAERMTRILLIEIQAFHTFAWAESLLSDSDLVAGAGDAGRLVACVRADETPHVEYLKTALTELRDRTWLGDSRPPVRGRRHDRTYLGSGVARVDDGAVRSEPRASCRLISNRSSTAALARRISLTGSTNSRTEQPDEVRHLLRAPDRPALGRGHRRQLIQDALDQVELADQLGIQYVWEVEHHFLEEYSHSSAPEVFLAAAAASAPRTSASATASCSPPRSSTIRPASPSASPCSTSSRTGGSSSARASRRARPSWAASRSIRFSSARCGSKASRSPSAA